MESPPAPVGPSSDPGPPASPVPSRRRRKWTIGLGVLLITLAVVIPTVLVVGPTAPWVEAVLAEGRLYIDVPLSTMYTVPTLPDSTAGTSAEVSFTSGNVTCLWNETSHRGSCGGRWGDSLLYDWSVVSGADMPVKFVMRPQPSRSDANRRFDFDGRNGFIFYPAGPQRISSYSVGASVPPPVASYLNTSQGGPGRSSVFVLKWAMDYTVRKMGVFQGLAPTSYLEVEYRLTVLDRGSVLTLPAANVSLPSSTDLWTPDASISSVPRTTWGIDAMGILSSFRLPPPPVTYGSDKPYFGYDLRSITIDAGAGGQLSVRLTSHYYWSYAATKFSWNETARFRASLDMRFGSVLLEYA